MKRLAATHRRAGSRASANSVAELRERWQLPPRGTGCRSAIAAASASERPSVRRLDAAFEAPPFAEDRFTEDFADAGRKRRCVRAGTRRRLAADALRADEPPSATRALRRTHRADASLRPRWRRPPSQGLLSLRRAPFGARRRRPGRSRARRRASAASSWGAPAADLPRRSQTGPQAEHLGCRHRPDRHRRRRAARS